MKVPLVSICIPAYNNSLYIRETVNSVLTQDYKDFELVIVDDNSTDNTWEIISEFSDPRIRKYRNEKNLGMHGNWTKALSMAEGVYMKLLCGDDLIYPDCISRQVKAFEEAASKDLVMVSCRRRIITSTGKVVPGSFYKLFPGRYSGKKAMRACAFFGTNLIGEPMAVLFKAEVFKKNQIVLGSNNYLIDLDMYSKILKYGSLVVLKDYLAAFRIYPASMSGTLGWKHARYFRDFIFEPRFRRDFGMAWYHRAAGTLVTYSITLARNIVFKLSS